MQSRKCWTKFRFINTLKQETGNQKNRKKPCMFMFYSLPFHTEKLAVYTYQAILQSDWSKYSPYISSYTASSKNKTAAQKIRSFCARKRLILVSKKPSTENHNHFNIAIYTTGVPLVWPGKLAFCCSLTNSSSTAANSFMFKISLSSNASSTNCDGSFCFSPRSPTTIPTAGDCCTCVRCVSFLA